MAVFANVNGSAVIGELRDEDVFTIEDEFSARVLDTDDTPWVSCVGPLNSSGSISDSSVVDFVSIVIVPVKINILTSFIVESKGKESTS